MSSRFPGLFVYFTVFIYVYYIYLSAYKHMCLCDKARERISSRKTYLKKKVSINTKTQANK